MPGWAPRRPRPFFDVPGRRQIVIVLTIVGALLLAKNLMLESPLMAGDEYGYFAPSQTFPNLSERFAGDPYIPRYYSPVLSACGALLAVISNHPELLLKIFNTVAFVSIVLVFLALIGRFDRAMVTPIAAAVFVLLPSSAYAAYFMPEIMYTLLFALLTWAVVLVLPSRVTTGAIVSGVIIGVMLLVKPHALALCLAMLLTFGALLVAPSSAWPDRRRVIVTTVPLFLVSAYLTMISINGVISRHLDLSPLAFVGTVYHGYFASGVSASSWIGRGGELLSILGGHLVVFGALIAPAVALGFVELRGLYMRRASADGADERSRFLLIVFTACVTALTLGMTVNFTGQAAHMEDAYYVRLLGRYYSFVIPLFLVIFFASYRTSPEGHERWLRIGAAIGCFIAIVLFHLEGQRTIYPFDYPEAFVFSSWHGNTGAGFAATVVTQLGIALAVAGYALMLWRGRSARLVYPALLIALFAISNVRVTAWQFTNSLDNSGLRADARSMSRIIAPSERNDGLVVGPEWNGALAYFLFNFGSSAHVLVRPEGSPITAADLPAGTRWVVLIGHYTAAFPAGASHYTPRVTLTQIAAASPRTP